MKGHGAISEMIRNKPQKKHVVGQAVIAWWHLVLWRLGLEVCLNREQTFMEGTYISG